MLHITNGAVVAGLLRALGLKGDIVTWDDVLHEGPVQGGLSPAALRASRAAFLARSGAGDAAAIARDFEARDRAAQQSSSHDEVVLWFEHDLYDQLQLLQVLDLVPTGGRPRVSAVAPDGYLGTHSPAHLATLFTRRTEVSTSARAAAHAVWTAFRSSDPRAIVDVIPRTVALPHLGPALTRHLQQLPWVATGLSRTEAQALAAVARGTNPLGDLYKVSHQEQEEAIFMGDLAFLDHLRDIVESRAPLLQVTNREHTPGPLSLEDIVELTDLGRDVLAGTADRVRAAGIERWLGGVHLSGRRETWRWDPDACLVKLA